jgi:hypothetical protein
MNDRTWPPAGERRPGDEPGEPGFGRVLPGPWPAHPGRALHPGDTGAGVVEADFVARADEHWLGFDDIDVFSETRRVPPADPGSPFAARPAFPPASVTRSTSAPPAVPPQGTQGTPPGGWPALGSPANAPARPRTWPGTHPAGSRPAAPVFMPPVPAFPDPVPPPPAPRRARRHLVGYPLAIAASLAIGIAIGGGAPLGEGTTPVTAVPSARTSGGGPAGAERDGVRPFGETVRFADGSTLTTGAPAPFTPTDVAFGGEEFPHHVKVKVTVVNNSGAVFDPTLAVGSVTSGGREGQPVYQTAFDPPDDAVLPGRRVTWWLGFGVADPARVTLTVRTGSHEDAIFTNEG